MKISPIKTNNISFSSGKSFLYTDFDGTFLPQSLSYIYEAPSNLKKRRLRSLNSYFQDFQDFIDATKGDFAINITTGRRFSKDKTSGFQPTYEKMKQKGIVLPKIKSVITSNGGDVHYFNLDGTLNPLPDSIKAQEVKEACGWDDKKVREVLDDVSKEMKVDYRHMRHSRGYKFSIALSDSSKLEEFSEKVQQALSGVMSVNIKNEQSHYPDEPCINGIKIQPNLNGRYLKKDFDVILAIKKAIANDDFVIFAGNEDNDKEALNIFSYLKKPPGGKIPFSVDEISDDYASMVKKEIDTLPLKILFIEPPKGTTNPKTLKLAEFMQKTSELFPKNIEIVKQTEVGENNNFLDAIKRAIKMYSNTNPNFAKSYKKNMTAQAVKKTTPIALCALFLGASFKKINDKFGSKKEKERINKQWLV